MTYIKLLTVLAGLALLTACGGSSPTTPANNSTGGDNSGGDNSGGGSGNATDCTQTPFHNDCLTNNAPALALRVADCITAGNAGIARCNNLFTESASNTCLTNPFTDACTSDTEFDDYADMARTNRVSFCASDSTGSSLCTALTTCQTNPFDASCGAYFESAKNPYCEANPTEDPCVNTADWLASFTGNDALPTTPDATTRKSQFLQATTTGFNTGANADIRAAGGNPTENIAIQTLTFNNAATATGGMAFFGGELYTAGTSTGNNFYYAGILAGTDLGAPITETITTAVKWRGQIRAVASNLLAQLDAGEIADFELDITFDGAKGTITTSFALGTSFIYEIDGMFDENGIITGRVDYGAGNTTDGINMTGFPEFYSPGTLTGIIGQNGAVGAFHSGRVGVTAGADGPSFSGGFIALPPSPCQVADTCVNTADWLASFTGNDALTTTPDATTRKNEFLQATATGFNTGANADIRATISNPLPITDIAIETLTFDNTATATGGAAFFGGSLFNDSGMRVANTYYYYAGILARTNLGAPITKTITSARWTGQIRADSRDSAGALTANPTDGFGLDITFDGAKGTITTSFARGPSFVYEIDGMFDENGIITGSVDYGPGDTTNGINTSHSTYSPGTLTGIIGQNGAVGAFHSGRVGVTTGAFGFAGGFVAEPPDPCIALDNCPANTAAWLRSFTTELSATPTRENKFIQGTADGFNSGDYDSTVLALNFNDVFTDGNMTDGFAYFNAGSHVAIFSGTDLGAALPLTQRASVEWSGFIRSSVGFTTATAFSLTVGFTGTGGTLDALIQSSIGTTLAYDIDGEFDAKGVITGNVTRGRYASSVSGCTPLTVGGNPNTSQTCFNSADGENITATLSGIIGAEGAVGVFQGGTSYAGGFVAKPQ